MDEIEQAIDEELKKVNLHPSENDSESDDDSFNVASLNSNLLVEDELPDSLITYVEASRNQMNAFEHLILEDVEEKDVSSKEPCHRNPSDNTVTEPASDFIDDPINWKERVISELQEQVGRQKSVEITNMSCNDLIDMTEHDISTESELQLSLEWRELEKRLNEEEEKKRAAQEVEKELHLNSEREEEMRRKRLMEFEEELMKMEKFQNDGGKVYHAEDLQMELDKQQILIQNLEQQMKEEKQALEEAQEEERRRIQKLRCRAATQIQVAFRGTLARRWFQTELRRKREKEKRHEQEKRELEKMKKQREEERKRMEEEERLHREEMERRRADYERAKEQERHRLEKEQNLEQQRRADEDRRRKIERKEEQNNITSVEDDCKRKKEDEDKTNKENKKTEVVRRHQMKDQLKLKEERGGKNKINELIVQTKNNYVMKDNNERRRTLENTSEDDMNMIKTVEDSETLNYTRPQINSDTDIIKRHEEEKEVDSNEKPDTQMKLSQSRKTLTLSTDINAHQDLTSDLAIGPVGCSVADNAKGKATDLTIIPASDLNVMSTDMDSSSCQNTTTMEIENCQLESQESVSVCLPDSTEQKRLAWMLSCTPWSKLSMLNKRKDQSQKRRPGRRRGPILPPMSKDTILKTGAWDSLKQVTTVTLEDLPGCSLSTLSECHKLQTLTLRRCRLTALDGLNQCAQIRYIDVQENSISHVDCGGLANLQVLLLGRNQLMDIHGLDGAENLQTLQLSHNNISRISGLGALKKLLRLSVDHNQLLSTRGLKEIYTLLHLDCSYNHLSHVEGLENCALLNTLDLRGNSLTELPVLQNHVLLRDLYLDDNLISSLDDLVSYWLPLLQNLSVTQNSVTHLSTLLDFVSLRRLDVSHNCLSDLESVCLNLQECINLQELNLTGNPLQHENNWRSLILETVPGLIKLNNEQIAATAVAAVGLWKGPEQQWSFLALCQAQQDQRRSLLQQQKMEISFAPSQHDAQLLAIGHQTDLFRLAVEQRYAHEYGDSCVTEDFSSSYVFPETSSSQQQSPEKQPHHTEDWVKHNQQKTQNSQSRLELQSADCVETQSEKEPVQALNLKIAAAVVIQRFWRRRREGLPGLIEKTNTKLNLHKVEDTCTGRPDTERAAVVIQAVWRGCVLRKRLARALAAAQIIESDDDFEEVDMDEFIFDEKELEKDWITLHSDALPARMMAFSEEQPLPKSPLLHPVPPKTLSVFPRQPKNAWSDSEDATCLEQNVSPHHSSRSVLKKNPLCEESEKVLQEWGITNDSTALLILKRANKMMGRKQQQKRLLDPTQRLALFRSHSRQCVSTEAQRRTRPTCKDNYKGHQGVNEIHKSPKAEEKQTCKEKTYQWLDSTDTGRDHFLPDIGHDVLNGRRVQLVATGDRDGVDSVTRFWTESTGVSPPPKMPIRRYSAENKKTEVPSPIKANSASNRNQRISFRDSPVRHSGGWGGGKKRAKVNK